MNNNNTRNRKLLFAALIVILLIIALLGLLCGSVEIPFKELIQALSGQNSNSKTSLILWSVRFPRLIAGIFAGAGLGVSGVILQIVMNNALAGPNTIGVNSGAGFFVMLSMMLIPQNLFARSLMAFAGAMLTSVLILFLAYAAGKSRMTIILAGIAVSSILSAGMNMMRILDTDVNVNIVHFTVGSLSTASMDELIYPVIGISIAIVVTMIFHRALNILALGDGVASSLGLSVNLFRIIFVMIASFLAGLVVSYAGLIGFVGLIVPHICRYLVGQDTKYLVPACALIGAILVVLADLIGRVLFAPYEIPAGIILSFIGGPFFIYLLMKKGGRRVNA